MKTTIKLFLIVTMFCATAFADGNQGSGGRDCQPGQENCTPPECTENCGGAFAVSNDDGEITVIFVTEIVKKFYRIGF